MLPLLLQVDHYKGLKDYAVFQPHSHFSSLSAGQHTQLYNATTIALVQQRLDLRLEAALGYSYAAITAIAREHTEPSPVSRKARLWI